MGDNWYICFNPEKTNVSEVPSDIRGIDRIQYVSFAELEDKLTVLLEQRYPRTTRTSVDEYFAKIQNDVLTLLSRQSGLKLYEIAEVLGVNKKMAQAVLKQMVESGSLKIEGKTKATKYFATLLSGKDFA